MADAGFDHAPFVHVAEDDAVFGEKRRDHAKLPMRVKVMRDGLDLALFLSVMLACFGCRSVLETPRQVAERWLAATAD